MTLKSRPVACLSDRAVAHTLRGRMSLRALVPAVRGAGSGRRSAGRPHVPRVVGCRASGRPPRRGQSPSFLQWDGAELDEGGSDRPPTGDESSEVRGDSDTDWEVSTPRGSAGFSRPWGDWGASYFDSAEVAGADRARGAAQPPLNDDDDGGEGYVWGDREREAAPDVTPLDRQELEDIMSVSATGSQYSYYWGTFDTALQRVFASLFCGLVTANVAPIVAVPTGLYFLWAPVALAARRNAPLRRFAHAGIWHTRVLLEVPMAPELGDIQARIDAQSMPFAAPADTRCPHMRTGG